MTFHEWFVALFGLRPCTIPWEDNLRAKVAAGQAAERTLDRAQEWDQKRDAALKAWCAKGGEA